MLKKLWPHARPFTPWILAGVACSAMEAVFELLIPLVMSDIVDVGIAGGRGEGLIFAKGEILRKVPQERLVDELMAEIDRLP